MNQEKTLRILHMIAEDMEKDAKKFDGRPFTGKTIAEYFGNHGAAIAALATLMGRYIKENDIAKEEE